MLKLDLIETLAFAGVALFAGYGIRRLWPLLARFNLPAPVIGGLVVAVALTAARGAGYTPVTFDTTLQAPLMIGFFATVGFQASVGLLKVGGPQVLLFLALSTVVAVAQNVVGIAIAAPFGLHPLFGVLAGSVTLTGGPATGLAFAPQFEQAGVPAAEAVAVAAAMMGIVSGGLVGGPLGTYLVEKFHLRKAHGLVSDPKRLHIEDPAPEPPQAPAADVPADESARAHQLVRALVLILVALWVGGWVSKLFSSMGVTLPAYIGAMLVAALMRNLDDATGWLKLPRELIDDLGSVALSLFIAMALMSLRLWRLAEVAVPLVVIVLAQIAVVLVMAAGPVFRLMKRDYDAAVMASGFVGFMLGTTANAVANMEALVERYGLARRAFLVVPMVGAFFIDFTNALIITGFLNALD